MGFASDLASWFSRRAVFCLVVRGTGARVSSPTVALHATTLYAVCFLPCPSGERVGSSVGKRHRGSLGGRLGVGLSEAHGCILGESGIQFPAGGLK